MSTKVWKEVALSGGSVLVEKGQRYAALADVTRDASLSSIVSYLNGHGWTVTYAWQQGQPTRDLYAVDSWLSGLSPDTTDNHRWVWIEANRTGVDAPPGSPAVVAPVLPPVTAPSGPAVPGAVWVVGGAAVLGLLYYLL